tara:strand:- start:182 stop:340 length:159 start_codon:yes stop_codon:yes gene_type:complete
MELETIKSRKFWITGTHPIVGGYLSSGGSTSNSKQFHERHLKMKVKPEKKWL